MSIKNVRENFRVDMLTSELLVAMAEKLSSPEQKVNKSDVIRSAVYRMAKNELSGEEFQKLVEVALDKEKM